MWLCRECCDRASFSAYFFFGGNFGYVTWLACTNRERFLFSLLALDITQLEQSIFLLCSTCSRESLMVKLVLA